MDRDPRPEAVTFNRRVQLCGGLGTLSQTIRRGKEIESYFD